MNLRSSVERSIHNAFHRQAEAMRRRMVLEREPFVDMICRRSAGPEISKEMRKRTIVPHAALVPLLWEGQCSRLGGSKANLPMSRIRKQQELGLATSPRKFAFFFSHKTAL